MDIIKLKPYKRLSDQELIKEISQKMLDVHEYHNDGDYNNYLSKVMILDNLIKEGKSRKVSLDDKGLARKIFKQ